MAWTETCKMDAVAQINKRKEFCRTLVEAFRELSKESGIPANTLKRWYYPETNYKCTRNDTHRTSPAKETSTITNFHTMQFDLDRKKIVFGLSKTDDNRFLVMQEFKVGGNGKDTSTTNRFTMSVVLISELRVVLDQVEAMIKEVCSGESNVGGLGPQEDDQVESPAVDDSDHEEDDEVEPPDGDPGGVPQDNVVDPNGEDVKLSSPPADGAEATTVEAEFIQCVDCKHFAIKTWAPEEDGACNLIKGNWNGVAFQPPQEPHPCQNFLPRDQQPGEGVGSLDV